MSDTNKIEELWDNLGFNYKDLNFKLKFIKNRKLEHIGLNRKIDLLAYEIGNMAQLIEKINFTIDDIYANKGTIGNQIADIDIITTNRKKKINCVNTL